MQTQVKAYTLSTCSHCKRAKELLNELGVKFDYTDVDLLPESDKKATIEEIRKVNPRCTFPTLLIGDHVVIGANEFEIREALGLK